MKKHGWHGQGLGKNENGITDLITPTQLPKGKGLGFGKRPLNKTKKPNLFNTLHAIILQPSDPLYDPDDPEEQEEYGYQVEKDGKYLFEIASLSARGLPSRTGPHDANRTYAIT